MWKQQQASERQTLTERKKGGLKARCVRMEHIDRKLGFGRHQLYSPQLITSVLNSGFG